MHKAGDAGAGAGKMEMEGNTLTFTELELKWVEQNIHMTDVSELNVFSFECCAVFLSCL